jgi:hypothetical protein
MNDEPREEQCAPNESTPKLPIQADYRGTLELSEGLNWSLGHPPFLWESGDLPATGEEQNNE